MGDSVVKRLRQILMLLLIICVVGGVYYVYRIKTDQKNSMIYRDEFHHLDRDFWYVGEWTTMFKAYNKVSIKNDVLTAEVNEVDRGPFLLSKPIPVKKGDVITVKRRVKLHYGNDKFIGGMAIVETHDSHLKPQMVDNGWGVSLGRPLALVEYVHFYGKDLERPGNDNFRVLGANWKENNSYELLEPTYDEWFEEILVYDTKNDEIRYTYGDQTYKVEGHELSRPYIRVFMHSYGWYTGHCMKIDWVEIKVDGS